MLVRLLAICLVVLFSASVAAAGELSAEGYLALRKSLGVSASGYAEARANPSAWIGKVVELKGSVNGVARCGKSASFILNCGNGSLLISAADLPECASNGNTLRILAKVAPGCVASLSELILEAAIYEYDISTHEKKLAASAKPIKKETRPVVQKPITRATPARGRLVGLSSRAMQIFNPYKAAIKQFNRRLTDDQANTITASILAYSEHYGIDPRLVVAVVLAESHFRLDATSHAGAMGLGQLMPGTAAGLGVGNPYDPVQNIGGCVKLIRGHLDKQGNLARALACYNAGPGAVKKYGGVPPYRETQNYVRKVTAYYNALCGKK